MEDMVADIYAPLPNESMPQPGPPAPVIVFLPPQIRPFAIRKTIFSSLGANLAELVGAVVVIPNLTNYPVGRIRQQVEDTRVVLHWIMEDIHRYGGDPERIYLSGMGTSGLLALLVPLQAAIVESRNQFLAKEAGITGEELPQGVKDVKASLKHRASYRY